MSNTDNLNGSLCFRNYGTLRLDAVEDIRVTAKPEQIVLLWVQRMPVSVQ